MNNEQEMRKTLAEIAFIADCQTAVHVYKELQNVAWQGVNLYYLRQAQGEQISKEDSETLRSTFKQLFKIVEPLIKED